MLRNSKSRSLPGVHFCRRIGVVLKSLGFACVLLTTSLSPADTQAVSGIPDSPFAISAVYGIQLFHWIVRLNG